MLFKKDAYKTTPHFRLLFLRKKNHGKTKNFCNRKIFNLLPLSIAQISLSKLFSDNELTIVENECGFFVDKNRLLNLDLTNESKQICWTNLKTMVRQNIEKSIFHFEIIKKHLHFNKMKKCRAAGLFSHFGEANRFESCC